MCVAGRRSSQHAAWFKGRLESLTNDRCCRGSTLRVFRNEFDGWGSMIGLKRHEVFAVVRFLTARGSLLR